MEIGAVRSVVPKAIMAGHMRAVRPAGGFPSGSRRGELASFHKEPVSSLR